MHHSPPHSAILCPQLLEADAELREARQSLFDFLRYQLGIDLPAEAPASDSAATASPHSSTAASAAAAGVWAQPSGKIEEAAALEAKAAKQLEQLRMHHTAEVLSLKEAQDAASEQVDALTLQLEQAHTAYKALAESQPGLQSELTAAQQQVSELELQRLRASEEADKAITEAQAAQVKAEAAFQAREAELLSQLVAEVQEAAVMRSAAETAQEALSNQVGQAC